MRTICIRVINVNWASNSVVVVGTTNDGDIVNQGNFVCLCGPKNHYMNGAGLNVCGGYTRQAGFNRKQDEMIT